MALSALDSAKTKGRKVGLAGLRRSQPDPSEEEALLEKWEDFDEDLGEDVRKLFDKGDVDEVWHTDA